MKDLRRASGRASLKVYLFNVGQGDNLLLELPNGEFGLLDFYYDEKLRLAEPPSLTYLRHLHPHKPVISFVCISHPDRDHIRGVDNFYRWVEWNNIKVRRVFLFSGWDFAEMKSQVHLAIKSALPHVAIKERVDRFAQQLDAISALAARSETPVEYVQDIRPLAKIGRMVEVMSIGPLGSHTRRFNARSLRHFCAYLLTGRTRRPPGRNDVSGLLLIRYLSHNLLFGGDAGERVWSECLKHFDELKLRETYGTCKASFVKASHHGAESSSSVALWRRILGEKYRVGVSAGRTHYGHPRPKMLVDISTAKGPFAAARRVFSTNVCEKCLMKQERDFANLELPNDGDVPTETRHELNLNRARYYRFGPAVQTLGLAAYILQFNANGTTQLKLGVTRQIPSYQGCIYGEPAKNDFPECALRLSG